MVFGNWGEEWDRGRERVEKRERGEIHSEEQLARSRFGA